MDVLAIYHSHPDECTYMSDLDAQPAARWSYVPVVISLKASRETVQVLGHQHIGARLSGVELICPDGQFALNGWAGEWIVPRVPLKTWKTEAARTVLRRGLYANRAAENGARSKSGMRPPISWVMRCAVIGASMIPSR